MVDLDDRITLATPEGVELHVALAGLGSRFMAGALDLLIQLLLIGIVALLAAAAASNASAVVMVVGSFVIWFFYPVLFEVLRSGQTPGKRAARLRVIRASGSPVDLPASAIRNLMRLIDGATLLYLPTVIGIAVTARHQRPGDLAAGTLVIRESPKRAITQPSAGVSAFVAADDHRWEASAITRQETAAIRHFLERRDTLAPDARRQLALRLADGLRPKVSGVPNGIGPESFLEQLSALKRGE